MAFRGAPALDARGGIFNDVGRDQIYNTTLNFGSVVESAVSTVDEPQNDLTRLFTSDEWAALRKLRVALPRVFFEAFPQKKDAQNLPVDLWGVTLSPQSPHDARASVLLMTFLRTCKMDVWRTQERLLEMLRWREEFGVAQVIKENFPEDIFGNVDHFFGKDKRGRPMVYIRWAASKDIGAMLSDAARFLRWRVSVHERAMSLIDFRTVDKIIVVNDAEGISIPRTIWSAFNPGIYTQLFSASAELWMYQQFWASEYMIHLPTPIWSAGITCAYKVGFSVISSVRSINEIIVLDNAPSNISQGLLAVVDPEHLPKRYGGEADAL